MADPLKEYSLGSINPFANAAKSVEAIKKAVNSEGVTPTPLATPQNLGATGTSSGLLQVPTLPTSTRPFSELQPPVTIIPANPATNNELLGLPPRDLIDSVATLQQPFNIAPNFVNNSFSNVFTNLPLDVAAANLQTGLIPQNFNNGLQQQAPPITIARGELVGRNAASLPIDERNYQVPFFLQSILSTPAGSLPKGPLWVVVFDGSFDSNPGTAYIGGTGIPKIVNSIADYEPRLPKWNINNAVSTICSDNFLKTKGCILAQNVTLPGEQLYYTTEGLQYNGYIRGTVGNGRQDNETLRIGFLNTNVSFVDNVIRPWVIMTGHLGMIARPSNQQYRTNIQVHRLGVSEAKSPPFVLQTFTFWGACPISIDAEEYTQNDQGNVTIKTASFTYQWYTVDSSKNQFAQGPVASLTNNSLKVVPDQNSNTVNLPPTRVSSLVKNTTPFNLQ